jgi:hypothetical protein
MKIKYSGILVLVGSLIIATLAVFVYGVGVQMARTKQQKIIDRVRDVVPDRIIELEKRIKKLENKW